MLRYDETMGRSLTSESASIATEKLIPDRGDGPPGNLAPSATGALATLVYRSDAVRPFSDADLLGLTQAAQRRNHAESITGLVLYDDSRFFQWLEGPEDNLSRIMQSINKDGRHTNIEVIARQRTHRRTFAGWDLKLALPGASAASWVREVITPPMTTVAALRRRPEIAASVLEQMAPQPGRPERGRALTILESVLRTRVIPQAVLRHGAGPARPVLVYVHPQAADLASLLLNGGMEGAMPLLREASARPGAREPSHAASLAHLAEAAARHLGDMWLSDDCSEVEVTAALCALQTMLLRLERALPIAVLAVAPGGMSLVAPFPGEPHGLEAALAAHAFRRAGAGVRCAFPGSEAELLDLMHGEWFDTVDLSLSAAFRREDRLDAFTETVTLLRETSRNPDLRVTVRGRIFQEEAGAASRVGADPARPERGRRASA